MFDVIKHNVPDDLASLFTLKSGSRPSRRGSQFVIPRVKYEIGKQSIQYRGPTIWKFLNRLININESISKDKFKQILRKFSKDILKLINYSCSSYPTRAFYSGQVDEFRNPMKTELKTRLSSTVVFSTDF